MKWLKRIPSRVDRAIVVMVVSTGLLLPWAVGVGVKLYLQALGRPTWPWSDISVYAIYFGPFASVIAAAPLIILAILYREWTVGSLGRLSRATPLQGRLVVLFAFAGCVAGMVRVFIDVFWEFDPLVLWFIPGIVVMYLPWMAGGLVVGALLAVLAGFVERRSPGVRPRARDAGEGGSSGLDGRPGAGAGAASARHRTGGDLFDAELAQEAASRARSLRNAAGAAALVAGVLVLEIAGAPGGNFLRRVLFGLATVCFLWASWAVLRGAWLLGAGWKVGFFVCWILGPPPLDLIFALVVFLKLRRMSSEDHRGRPAGHARPPRMADA